MLDVPYRPREHRKPKEIGWWPTGADPRDGRVSAWFRCPNGHLGTLWVHNIAPDGAVDPSVVCSGCDFHDSIRLVGWGAQGNSP